MSTAPAVPTAAERAAHPIPFSVRVLRRLKPVVVALLKSPLHGLLSGDVLLLTYAGRKSGTPHTLPLSYARKDSRLYLCTRPEGSKWWLNLRGSKQVDLVLGGRAQKATATVLDCDCGEAIEGLRAFVTRNPTTGEMLYHVARGPNEDDLRREAPRSIVVRIDLA